MAKHTPGPWRMDGQYWADIHGANDAAICMLHSDGDVDDAPDADTALSNAHLIAAAPDLLAAADDVLAKWASGDLAGAVRRLGVAVAKARPSALARASAE